MQGVFGRVGDVKHFARIIPSLAYASGGRLNRSR